MQYLDNVKENWRHFRQSNPGMRYKALYLRRRHADLPMFKKFLAMFAGLVLLAAGLLMLAAPGPGLLFMFLGTVMLAQNSFATARTLDRIEARLRGSKSQ